MDTTTIEQDFAAAMLYAEEKHGRVFQAKVSAKSGVDSSNLNSIMKHGKGTKEAVRRKIFEAVAGIVAGVTLINAELQMISGHAKLESVKKYADVGLERIRELMEREPVEAERLRKVK